MCFALKPSLRVLVVLHVRVRYESPLGQCSSTGLGRVSTPIGNVRAPRRGYDVDIPRGRRGDAAATTWML